MLDVTYYWVTGKVTLKSPEMWPISKSLKMLQLWSGDLVLIHYHGKEVSTSILSRLTQITQILQSTLSISLILQQILWKNTEWAR